MSKKKVKPPQPSKVRMHWNAETQGEAKRPYRLWDAKRKCNVIWRCYSDARRAQDAALIHVKWAAIGESFEVYDCRTMKVLGVYTRKVNSVFYQEG